MIDASAVNTYIDRMFRPDILLAHLAELQNKTRLSEIGLRHYAQCEPYASCTSFSTVHCKMRTAEEVLKYLINVYDKSLHK